MAKEAKEAKEAKDGEAIIKTENVLIADLKAATYNPRKIHPQKYKALKKSIEKYGVLEPIIVNIRTGNTIVSGHQRVRACNELGIDTIKASFIDVDEQQEKMLNLAMNNIRGENEKDKLEKVMKDLVGFDLDLELTGFRLDEINNLVATPEEIENEDPEYPITPYFGEKYNYVLIFTKNEVDWTYLRNALGVETKQSYKSTAVGTSHVISFEEFAEKWAEQGSK